ncbi:MAG: ComF family protein [Defluviitaleaceae bacterium]|nr:ComF family protein [Defluviitaleaceae bacterium]
MDGKDDALCPDCDQTVGKLSKTDTHFKVKCDSIDTIYAAFDYCDMVRDCVFRYKYGGIKSLARQMATAMVDVLNLTPTDFICDFLIPVPLHPKRLKDRGYNQATLLAIELGILLAKPVYEGLERLRYTEKQFGLSPEERLANLSGAIGTKPSFDVAGKHIVLVDDIFTTGATANDCARALKSAGAKKIDLLAFSAAMTE